MNVHILRSQARESNMMKSLRRLVAPRADGSYLIPPEMVDKFKDNHGGGRQELLRMYEQCGGNKDHMVSCLQLSLMNQAGFTPSNTSQKSYSLPCSPPQPTPEPPDHDFDAQDTFIKTCRKKVQKITEDDLFVDGQFMSEQDMVKENFKEYFG